MPNSVCMGKKCEQQSKLSIFHRHILNTSVHELRIIAVISVKFISIQSISMSLPHSRIAWYDSPRKNANSFKISSSVKSWSGPQSLQQTNFAIIQFNHSTMKKILMFLPIGNFLDFIIVFRFTDYNRWKICGPVTIRCFNNKTNCIMTKCIQCWHD